MAKKGLLVLVLAAVVAGGAFAQMPSLEFSAGGGFVFDGGRVGGMSGGGLDDNLNHIGFGGFLFLDATFAELAISFMGGPALANWEFSEYGVSESGSESGSFTALDFSLVGKFPIALGGGNMTVFPMLGIGYSVVLSSIDDEEFSASDLSTFRITLGAGADFDINENLFFRASVLGYYRFAPSLYRDFANFPGIDAHGGFGATVRLGIGFRF